MATLKDIARLAKVHVSTVSRALVDSNEVSEEKRKLIKDIARELNYTPDFTARALAGKSSRLIGMVVPEIGSNYYTQIVKSVESKLNARGYNLMISSSEFDAKKEIETIEVFLNRKVDGIILARTSEGAVGEFLSRYDKNCPVPVIFLEPIRAIGGYDCIHMDGEYGSDLVIEHLKSLGHKSIGFIGEELSTKYRLPLFKLSLEKYGLKYDKRFVKSGKERFELGGYNRMKELIAGDVLPTAVFAAYDSLAIGAMKAAYEEGIRIPEDLSLVGHDNIRESEFLITPLTTVFPPIVQMAVISVNILINRIENAEKNAVQKVLLKQELIVRSTTDVAANSCMKVVQQSGTF